MTNTPCLLRRMRSLASLILLGVAGSAGALELSDGPLLIFTHPEKSISDPTSCSGSDIGRVEVMYLVDPMTSPTTHRITASDGSFEVLCRPARNKLLVSFHRSQDLYLFDLLTGLNHPLLGHHKSKYVASDGATIFFLEVRPESGDYGLCVVQATGSMIPRRMSELSIKCIVAVTKSAIWFATPKQELWRIGKDGTDCRKVCAIPDKWADAELIPKFSPDEKALALSAVPNGKWSNRFDLIVIDTTTGRTLTEATRIIAGSILEMNSAPALEFDWSDDRRIHYLDIVPIKANQETYEEASTDGVTHSVEIDIVTGKQTSTKLADFVMASYGLNHSTPDIWDKQHHFGLFENVEHAKYSFAGEPQPFVDLRKEDGTSFGEIAMSPDGNWAAYYLSPHKNYVKTEADYVYLADGKAKTLHKLMGGWVYDFKWLPAFKQP